MQWPQPLTLTLSPSDGAREQPRQSTEVPPLSGRTPTPGDSSLSPSDGERAGVRGTLDCIVTAQEVSTEKRCRTSSLILLGASTVWATSSRNNSR